jgi:hypothetical protein
VLHVRVYFEIKLGLAEGNRKMNFNFTKQKLLLANCIVAVSVGLAATAGAVVDDGKIEGRPVIERSGELFVLQFVPSSGKLNLKAAGNSVASASLDSSQFTLFGRVYPASRQPIQLRISPESDHTYTVSSLPSLTNGERAKMEVEVRNLEGKTLDQFQFDYSNEAKAKAQTR